MASNRRIRDEQPNRQEETRNEIIAAAKRLVKKHGLHKVTMDEIAAATGKKKSFLYYYYPGKREVLQAVVESEFVEMQRYVRQAVSLRTSAAERLRAFVLARLEAVIKQASEYGTANITSALQGLEPGAEALNLAELGRSFDRQEEHFVAGLIQQGIDEGAFVPLSPKVIEDVTYFLLAALRGAELELALSGKLPAVGPRMTRVIDVFLHGLAQSRNSAP